MIDYGNPDDKPLLENIDKEFYSLEDRYKVFMSCCETIEKEIAKIKNIQDKEKFIQL